MCVCVCEAQVKVAPASSCVSGRIDHLIQIKDSPRSRGRDELLAPCKTEAEGWPLQALALSPELSCFSLLLSFIRGGAPSSCFSLVLEYRIELEYIIFSIQFCALSRTKGV